MLTTDELTRIADIVAEGADWELRNDLVAYLKSITESKDLADFRGEISLAKQTAIRQSASMAKPVAARRADEKSARADLEKLISGLELRMDGLLSRYKSEDPDRKISDSRFKSEMTSVLRIAYMEAYQLGTRASGLTRAGDLEFHLGTAEKGWLTRAFSSEQKYFAEFLAAVMRGESVTKSRNRIRAYAAAVRSIYDASRVLQLPEDVVLHWVLESKNPCRECKLLHLLSPYTRDTLPTSPRGGSTRCLANCKCKLRVAKARPGEVEVISRKNRSAEYLLSLLAQSRKVR